LIANQRTQWLLLWIVDFGRVASLKLQWTNQFMFGFLFWNVDFGRLVSLIVWTNQLCVVGLDFELHVCKSKEDKRTNRKWLLYK
jgi:hypothetical protein